MVWRDEIGEPTNLKYPTTLAQRATPVGIDEGNVSTEMKKPLSTPKIKWSGETKPRDKEITTEIRSFFGPQMKWKRGRKSRKKKNVTV